MTKTPRAASDMRTNAWEILAPYLWVLKLLVVFMVARALFTAVRRARTIASANALDYLRTSGYYVHSE